MKTFIINTKTNGLIATQANNKSEAFAKVKSSYPKAQKSSILISACHIDFVSCNKI